jgi:hypothetical protein
MFCLQIKVRDWGYDTQYAEGRCWWNANDYETVFDDDANFKEPEGDDWQEFGYKDRWQTVMVAFTERGLKDYMSQDGHNVTRRAHNGETRIYVETFNRCEEMIRVRKAIMEESR